MTGEPGTLLELWRAGRPADPTAKVFVETPNGTRVTYADAENRSARLARALSALGLQPGDRLAMQVEKSPDALLVYLACLRSGVVFIPLNPSYTAAEVAFLLDDAEPALFVDEPRLADLLSAAEAEPPTFSDAERTPDDLAAILYTSGTTGRPKGAMLTHGNLAGNADGLRTLWGFSDDDTLLHALPIFHAHGLFVAVHCVVASGASMVFLPRFDVTAVLAALPHCTVMMGVPTHYTRLLDDPGFDRSACRSMRLFISGSAPLLATTHEAFRARTDHAILERYGMTETVMMTSNPLDAERRPGTVGFPLPSIDLRIADQDATGAGAIEVKGPNVFAGYWRRPELSITEFTEDGWFRTGDIGRFDQDGYLAIIGREKDLVISGGLNVYPTEVEQAIDGIDGVVESAVIGLPDPDLGEVVVAVVVVAAGATTDASAVCAALRPRLAGFKLPKRIEFVDALPRNAMGKVEKAELRGRFGSPPHL